ncbi:MAG: M56 family metallopeptidase, partial [Caulobacteraceae bacterium]
MTDPTISELLVLTLLRAQIAASLAILAVAALRGPVRRLAGPGVAYRLWGLVPVAGVSSLFPTLAEFMRQDSLFGAGRIAGGGAWLRALSDDGFWGAWAQGLG